MARDSGYNDRNRDGVDDNVDGKAGNRGASKGHAQVYDPRSESEYSPYTADAQQAEFNRKEAGRQVIDDIARDARSKVHFWPSAGKFIIPEENTWAAHSKIVRN